MQMEMYETHYVNGQIKRRKKIMLIKPLKFSCWKALVKLGIFILFDGHLGLQIHLEIMQRVYEKVKPTEMIIQADQILKVSG